MSADYPVKCFKSFADALKALELFVRRGDLLRVGRPLQNFGGALPREVWANLLICAASNFHVGEDRFELTSDPLGGDGIILDAQSGETFRMEHAIAITPRGATVLDAETEILKAINHKVGRGPDYGKGKSLVVFTDLKGRNEWHANRVAKQLPNPLHFETVWVVAFQKIDNGEYIYAVTTSAREMLRFSSSA